MLIDENIYTGSLNIAQRYTSKKYGSRAFRDLCIKLMNHDAKYKAKDFILDCIINNKKYIRNFDEEDTLHVFDTVEKYYHKIDELADTTKPRLETCSFIREEPPNITEISSKMVELVKNSKRKIQIIQPYIQNITEFEDALEDAMKRDVEVEIITARKRDQPIYSSLLNADLFKRLLACGAKVYEEPYKYLHMKALAVDGEYLSIGSFNQDNTSFYCNNEANVLVKRNTTTQNLQDGCMPSFERIFNKLKCECIEVRKEEHYTTFGQIKANFWKYMFEVHYFVMHNRKK